MKWLILFTIIISSTFCFALETLLLKVGDVKVLPASSLSRVRVGKSKIIKVFDNGNSIKLFALKPGVTPLFIGSKAYRVYVFDKDKGPLVHKMHFNILQIPFLKLVELTDKQLVLEGHFLKFRDYLKIVSFTQELDLQLIFNGEYSNQVQEKIKDYIQEKIKARGLPEVDLKFDNGIKVFISESFKKDSAYIFLKSLGANLTYSNNLVLSPLIETKVYIAEVNKSFQRNIGIAWPQNIQWKVINNSSEISLEAMIDMLETKGDGQVLARPTLICRSGEEADFIAGGEFAIKVRGFDKDGVSWKKHGILLNIKPVADTNNRIQMQLSSEVSFIDNSVNIDGIPGLKTNKISTSVNLLSQQTLVLSGLIKHQKGQSYNGLPYLNQIPILGHLFKSQSFLDNKSELMIFLKSKVVKP